MRVLVLICMLLFHVPIALADGCADYITGPVGKFKVIALRVASDVESTPPDGSIDDLIGEVVSFDEPMFWFDGVGIQEYFTVLPIVAVIYPQDPNLSDVMIRPPAVEGIEDCWKMDSLALKSNEGTIDIIMMIDRRVLVVPVLNSSFYAILEKPLEPEEVARLQSFLIEEGHYNGEFTGEMDEETIIAVGFYAKTRGANYRFARTAITENLLTGLGIFNFETQ